MSTRTYDPLVNIVGALQRAQYRYGTDDLEFAIERAEEVIRVRGRRLQLEGSGIPLLQFALLRVLSGLIVLTYTYLTLARRPAAGAAAHRAVCRSQDRMAIPARRRIPADREEAPDDDRAARRLRSRRQG